MSIKIAAGTQFLLLLKQGCRPSEVRWSQAGGQFQNVVLQKGPTPNILPPVITMLEIFPEDVYFCES